MSRQTCCSLLFFLLSLNLPAQDISRIDQSTISVNALDSELQRLTEAANVHGMAVAVLSSEEVLFQKAYGYSNLKTKTPLKLTHNFYAASLSKPLFAFIVMKLVDQGVLDLDKSLVTYLDQPLYTYKFKHGYEGYDDLEGDDRYQSITARMCLAHTTGFPNWRYIGKAGINMEKPLTIETDPGTVFGYSGEGIQLLQFVVEQITDRKLEELAQEHVFQPFDMQMTSYLWQDRFEGKYAVGHAKKKKVLERKKRNVEYAAGSMDTTPADYIKFLQAMLAKEGLSEKAYTELIKPQIRIRSLQQFGSNSQKMTDANDDIQLSYGLGWGLYETPHGPAVFKEGHIMGWEHYVIFYPAQDLALMIMTNSSNGEGIFKELLETAVGDRWMPWYWENYFPYNFKG